MQKTLQIKEYNLFRTQFCISMIYVELALHINHEVFIWLNKDRTLCISQSSKKLISVKAHENSVKVGKKCRCFATYLIENKHNLSINNFKELQVQQRTKTRT